MPITPLSIIAAYLICCFLAATRDRRPNFIGNKYTLRDKVLNFVFPPLYHIKSQAYQLLEIDDIFSLRDINNSSIVWRIVVIGLYQWFLGYVFTCLTVMLSIYLGTIFFDSYFIILLLACIFFLAISMLSKPLVNILCMALSLPILFIVDKMFPFNLETSCVAEKKVVTNENNAHANDKRPLVLTILGWGWIVLIPIINVISYYANVIEAEKQNIKLQNLIEWSDYKYGTLIFGILGSIISIKMGFVVLNPIQIYARWLIFGWIWISVIGSTLFDHILYSLTLSPIFGSARIGNIPGLVPAFFFSYYILFNKKVKEYFNAKANKT